MLYSYWKEDTLTDVYAFLEENTILPHSEQACTTGTDFLVLNNAVPVLNGHYFLNISENANEVSYIDEIKLWVVDHPEGTQVGTTAEGEILTYSDLVFPYTCFDQNLVERRNEMLDPEQSFMGNDGDNLILDFPNNAWTSKALLVGMKTLGGEPYPEPKDCFGSGSHSDGDTSWIPDGYALTRQNPGTMLIDVSEDTSYTYRIDCVGDSVAIDYVYLVKLDTANVTVTEAPLDTALLWRFVDGNWQDQPVTQHVFQTDSVVVDLNPLNQLSLQFDSVPADTFLRDFVLQTLGFYIPNPGGQGGGQSGSPVDELTFALEITANPSLTDAVIVRYTVPYAANVEISVYDVTGRLVNELVEEEAVRGTHEVTWDRKDSQNRPVSSGTYFIRMSTETFEKSAKVTVLR